MSHAKYFLVAYLGILCFGFSGAQLFQNFPIKPYFQLKVDDEDYGKMIEERVHQGISKARMGAQEFMQKNAPGITGWVRSAIPQVKSAIDDMKPHLMNLKQKVDENLEKSPFIGDVYRKIRAHINDDQPQEGENNNLPPQRAGNQPEGPPRGPYDNVPHNGPGNQFQGGYNNPPLKAPGGYGNLPPTGPGNQYQNGNDILPPGGPGNQYQNGYNNGPGNQNQGGYGNSPSRGSGGPFQGGFNNQIPNVGGYQNPGGFSDPNQNVADYQRVGGSSNPLPAEPPSSGFGNYYQG